MSLIEYDLFGKKIDKVEIAIKRFQDFEPEKGHPGFFLANSGGKDSTVVRQLAIMAGVRFDAHYSATTVDPPELVRFIRREHPETTIDRPNLTMRELIIKKQFPPTRMQRYCCAELKEVNGNGRIVVTGVRWAESANRRKKRGLVNINGGKATHEMADRLNVVGVKSDYGITLNSDNSENRHLVECCTTKAKVMLNPIIDWSDVEVWEFIREYHVPYCELYDCGMKRLGCVGCPLGGSASMKRELEQFPQFKKFYIDTFGEMIEARKKSGKKINAQWKDGEAVLKWWVGDAGTQADERQVGLFNEEAEGEEK